MLCVLSYKSIHVYRFMAYIIYSVRKLFTGFAIAAFIAWKLIVMIVMIIAESPAIINTKGAMVIL